MPTIGDASLGVQVNTTYNDEGVKQASDSFLNLGDIIEGTAIGSALEDIAMKALDMGKAFLDAGFEAAAGLENAKVAFDTAFGNPDAASKMLSNLEEFSHQTQFNADQIDSWALRLKNMGVSADSVTGTIKNLANISAGSGTTVSEQTGIMSTAIDKLSIAYQRGSVTAIQLRGIASAGIPIYAALAEVLNTTQEAVAKGGKGFSITADQLNAAFTLLGQGKYANDALKQANTFTGAMKNIKDATTDTFRDILGVTAGGDIVKGGIFDQLRNSAVAFFTWIEDHKSQIEEFFKKLGDAINVVAGYVDKINKFYQSHKELIDALLIGIAGLVAIFIVLAAVIWLTTAAATAFGAIMAIITSPIFLVGLAIVALIAIGYLLIKHWGDVKRVAEDVWNAIVKFVQDAVTAAGNWIKNFINGVIDGINKLISGINDVAGKIPGVGKDIHIGLIPRLAGGTDFFQGGLALVGERGPEVVNLPRGSQVIPNGQSSMPQITQYNYNYNDIDMTAAMRELGWRIRR